jgi:hypothetical protein
MISAWTVVLTNSAAAMIGYFIGFLSLQMARSLDDRGSLQINGFPVANGSLQSYGILGVNGNVRLGVPQALFLE